jgi:hypothetical protein
LIGIYSGANAANRYSVASGNWNATSTWSASAGGTAGASFPVAGDAVRIENGDTITVVADAAATSITFTGAAATLAVTTGNTLTVSGVVTLNHNVGNATACSISGAGTLACASVNAGISLSLNGDHSAILTSTINSFNIGGNVTLTAKASGSNYAQASFRVEEGTTTIGGQITSAIDLSPCIGTVRMTTGAQTGKMILNGATPWGTLTNVTTTLNGTSSTVEYAGSSSQTILGTTYTNLKINTGGTSTLGTSTTVNGTLFMTKGALALDGFTLTFGALSSLYYNGSTAQLTTNTEFPATGGPKNLIIDNTNGLTLHAARTISGATTVNSGCTFATNATFTNSGTATINGTFQLNAGGWATGSSFTYGPSGTLNFNNTSSYGVNSGDVFWPTTNSPKNVSVLQGGLTLNAARTVTGLFQTAAGVSNANNLTLNGIAQINANGYFSGAPTYGAASTLVYNTGASTYGRGSEWSASSGAGYPANVTINTGSSLDLGNGGTGTARQLSGNLTLDGALYMDYGSNDLTQPLTILGNLIINTTGALSLSDVLGGDLKLQGNWTRNGSGVFSHKSRAVFFQGGTAQTLTGATTFDYLNMGKSANDLTLNNDITINQTLLFSDGTNGGNSNGGKIITGTNSVTIGPNGLNASGSYSSYVSGILKQAFPTASSKTFMIGKGGNYRPLTLNYTALSGTSTVTAEQFESVIPGSAPALTILTGSRYWQISENGGTSFTYSLTLDGTGFSPSRPVKMIFGNGSNSAYAVTTPDYTASGFTGFGNFGLGESTLKTSIADGSWYQPNSWSPSGEPTASDDIFVNHAIVIDGATAAVCSNLTINSGKSVTINTNKALTVNGTLANLAGVSGLVVKSDASLIESTPNIDATVERNITADKYHSFSPSVNGAGVTSNIFNITSQVFNVYLYSHSELLNANSASGYTEIPNPTTPLTTMAGYGVYADGTHAAPVQTGWTFTQQGDLNTGTYGAANNMTRTGAGIWAGFNYVGNPYPSYIDWNAASGWVKTNMDAATYVENSGNWAVFPFPGPPVNAGSNIIAPGQGFFVRVSSGQTAGTLSMNNAVRTHTSTPFLKSSPANYVRLVATGNDKSDETVVRFDSDATAQFDGQYDAIKLDAADASFPQIYSVTDRKLAYNALPETSTVQLGFKAGVSGSYTIGMNDIADIQFVTLADTKTGEQTDLSGKSYTFNYVAGENENRFVLHFSALSVNETKIADANIYSFQKTVFVNMKGQSKGDIYIYNISGQLVATRLAAQGMNEIGLAFTGNYVVKVVTLDNSMVRKVFVN